MATTLFDLGKRELERDIAIDPSELMLHENLKRIKVMHEEEVDVIVGIDCGSTQSRGILLPVEDISTRDMSEWFRYEINIPSISMSVREGQSLTRISNKLYDNLNSRMQLMNQQKEHVVRGPLCNQLNTNQNELLSSMKKIDNLALRLNIIDTIGYAIVRKACHVDKTFKVPGTINVALPLSLPPDELLKDQIEKLKQDLAYVSWSIPYMGENESIDIKVSEIKCYSEPEAQVRAYYGLSGQPYPSIVLMIEAGGRNSSASIRRSGVATNAKSPLDMSGSTLLSRIGNAYIEQFNAGRIDDEWLIYAFRKGLMKSGSSFENVEDLVKRQMDIVAEELFFQLDRHVMSRGTNISYEVIDAVVLGGRFFALGAGGYSTAVKLTEEIQKRSPNTDVIRLDSNYIPKGLLIGYIVDKQLEETAADRDIDLLDPLGELDDEQELSGVGM